MAGQRMRELLVNALLGMLGTLFILFGTGAWSLKESAADHRDDVQKLRAELTQEIDDVKQLQQRTLDVVCAGMPRARACGPSIISP